jgi:hypothetical protein
MKMLISCLMMLFRGQRQESSLLQCAVFCSGGMIDYVVGTDLDCLQCNQGKALSPQIFGSVPTALQHVKIIPCYSNLV